jgi:hypothetical protein
MAHSRECGKGVVGGGGRNVGGLSSIHYRVQLLYDSRGLVRVGGRVIVYHFISLEDDDGGGGCVSG